MNKQQENRLWKQLCSTEALKCGWHLVRDEMQRDFIGEPYSKDIFGHFLNQNISEILRSLKADDFRANSPIRILIPKSTLSTRPGTVLDIEDRVILFAALKLIAEQIDNKLSEGVYSYRVKKENNKSLFYESDIISLPFLKHKTIRKYLDPFDPWYGLWPKFDSISRKAFQDEDYLFMATSDIAAYFENIHLDILRDQLHAFIPSEQRIINLFHTAFSSWTYDTVQGRRHNRGIPQGSQISSFFGNIFLKPIDDAFENFKEGKDIKYYRYMDDIRIFTKSYKDARESILLLDKEIRYLHLNLQSAKTKIYDEKNNSEISAFLIDQRFAQIQDIDEYLESSKKAKIEPNFSKIEADLGKIIKQIPPKSSSQQRIWGAKKPFSGLSDRVFRRLVTMHLKINSEKIGDRLITEMQRNPDSRLGDKLIQHFKQFPRKKSWQTRLIKFLVSEENIFPFQEAQILIAMRYQSSLQSKIVEYAKLKTGDKETEDFIRVESFRLLSRCELDKKMFDIAEGIFKGTQSISVKKAATLILMRLRGSKNEEFIREVALHSNSKVSKMGLFLQAVKNRKDLANRILKQAFKEDANYLLVDYLPLLYLMIESKNKEIVKMVINAIKKSKAHNKHINMDMRKRCKEIFNFANQNLTDLN